ncbi:MFS transporter [Schaedlerella arabinosiphila]|uniref:MFS transporter n=1 Tax=Schaedlerella arabinosiphila TaxID=2044587 RepID=UPI002557D27C|nr:glycoside-pentoside-hexuronide (GPH):cation symporter [Schaedlerella arabinosiphila]
MENHAVTQEKTNKFTGFCYSFGEVGSQLSWYMINTYLTIFYTDIVGLTASAISLIMLIARVWDAINDPMMGVIADRTRTRWGKFRPYLMFASPFLAIFNVLTFTVFPVEGAAKVIICLICYIGAGMAYTAICVTYGGLVNLIARDSQIRMDYTSCRAIGSSVIQMILSAVAMPVILFFSQTFDEAGALVADARGYFITTVICSLIMLPCFWLCAWRCKENVVVETPAQSAEKKPVWQSLKAMCKNKMLLITVFCVFMGAIAIMSRMSMLTYYVIYVVGSFTMIAPIFTSVTVGQLIGSLLLPWGTRIFGKRNLLLLMNVVMVICFVIMFLIPANNNAFLIIISLIIGVTGASANVCTGMLSDCIEYGDWKYGIREEGLTYSYMSFGVKLATAVGGSVTVLLLAASGYVPNAEQTEAVKTGINAVVNLAPAVCIVISAIPLFWYKLDKKLMDQIRVELDERNVAKAK